MLSPEIFLVPDLNFELPTSPRGRPHKGDYIPVLPACSIMRGAQLEFEKRITESRSAKYCRWSI